MLPLLLSGGSIRFFAGALALAVVVGGSAYMGYQYRDGKVAQEKLDLADKQRAREDEIRNHYDRTSMRFENILAELKKEKMKVVTQIVEREVEKPDYSCLLPDSGLRTHRSVLETYQRARHSGKSASEVQRPGTDGAQGGTTDSR